MPYNERVWQGAVQLPLPHPDLCASLPKHGSWGCRTTNGYGRGLFNYLSPIPISVHPPATLTFYRPGVRPDILDIALAKNIPVTMDVQTVTELSSDHDPIFISLGAEPEAADGPLVRKINWGSFERIIGARNFRTREDIRDAATLESAACGLAEIIVESLDEAASYGTVARDRWLPQTIRQLLQEKRRAKKRALETSERVRIFGMPRHWRVPPVDWPK
ncbi:hypothetical protein QE152_g30844 [Popillia japonica]|uniref:Endonuclease/exonuclease/phosphatase domain-containing protein n=1 Tax=Popillia japonica TaxID=7064 RepID=A0AAW1JDK2_POPJA